MAETLEEGIYVASLTPLQEDLSCNTQELATHCQYLLDCGCKGVVLFGTTGEGSSFTVEERLQALQEVIAAGVDPKKLLLANGLSSLKETIELAKGAQSSQVGTLLIAPPSSYKDASDIEVCQFYREILRETPMQILLYHIPQHSSVPITLPVMETLHSEFPTRVIGLKESEGNLSFTKTILATLPNFQVFVGSERDIVEALKCGASGSICGLGNIYPHFILTLCEKDQTPEELYTFFEGMGRMHFVSVYKALLEKEKGSAWHHLRPPLQPLAPLEIDSLPSI